MVGGSWEQWYPFASLDRQVISPDVQPVALAKWHAFSSTNQLRVLIPKLRVILTNTHVHHGQLLLVKVHTLFTPQV